MAAFLVLIVEFTPYRHGVTRKSHGSAADCRALAPLLSQDKVLLTGERHRPSPCDLKEPFTDDVERFFAMLQFSAREKLKELPID
jgi:hypothetical protein